MSQVIITFTNPMGSFYLALDLRQTKERPYPARRDATIG